MGILQIKHLFPYEGISSQGGENVQMTLKKSFGIGMQNMSQKKQTFIIFFKNKNSYLKK